MPDTGVVTAPKVDAPSYGLFSVADVQKRSQADSHWVDGFYVETAVCSSKAEAITICAPTSDWNTIFDNTGGSPFFHVAAFTILETYECENSIGINAIDRRKTVREQLEAISEFAVEQELWLGTSAQLDAGVIPADRWLTGATDATPTPGTAIKPRVALALVEQAFAEANPGIQATIHVTPLIAAILGDGVFTDEGGVLYTTQGSKVAISRGGDGDEGPHTGGSATKHWIYATGPVHVDLGADELITSSMSEIVNAVTNKVTYVAERPAAVYFDGCAWFGVLADATL
jgi:hypothetical protein